MISRNYYFLSAYTRANGNKLPTKYGKVASDKSNDDDAMGLHLGADVDGTVFNKFPEKA